MFLMSISKELFTKIKILKSTRQEQLLKKNNWAYTLDDLSRLPINGYQFPY